MGGNSKMGSIHRVLCLVTWRTAIGIQTQIDQSFYWSACLLIEGVVTSLVCARPTQLLSLPILTLKHLWWMYVWAHQLIQPCVVGLCKLQCHVYTATTVLHHPSALAFRIAENILVGDNAPTWTEDPDNQMNDISNGEVSTGQDMHTVLYHFNCKFSHASRPEKKTLVLNH